MVAPSTYGVLDSMGKQLYQHVIAGTDGVSYSREVSGVSAPQCEEIEYNQYAPIPLLCEPNTSPYSRIRTILIRRRGVEHDEEKGEVIVLDDLLHPHVSIDTIR